MTRKNKFLGIMCNEVLFVEKVRLCDLHILCYTVYTLSKTQIKSDNGFIYKYSFLNGRIIVIFYLHSLGKKSAFLFSSFYV